MYEYAPTTLQMVFQIPSVISIHNGHFEKGYFYEGEYHDFWEITYVKHGQLNTVSDENMYIISENQAIVHKPMAFHKSMFPAVSSCDALFVSFIMSSENPSLFENKIFDIHPQLCALFDMLESECKTLIDHIQTDEAIWKIVISENAQHAATQKVKSILELIVIELTRKAIQMNTIPEKNPYIPFTDSYICTLYSTAVTYLNANIYGALSIEDICTHCNCSRSNLKRLFKKYMGMGVIQYFNKMKIKEAIKLLSEDNQIGEVTEKLSISSPQYFSRLFKQHTGMRPMDFKKRTLAR